MQKNIVKLQLISENTKDISKYKKLIGKKHNIEFVSEDCDYWLGLDGTVNGSELNPKRTIVLCDNREKENYKTEELSSKKSRYMYFMTEKYIPNLIWSLNMSYSDLERLETEKAKNKVFSVFLSPTQPDDCSLKVKKFLLEVEKELRFDIYGSDNNCGENTEHKQYTNYTDYTEYTQYKGNLKDKTSALLPYKYTFVAENKIAPNYFTEKIIDAILSECLVFYWGCPNISDFFDTNCFVYLDIEDITNSIRKIRQTIEFNKWEERIHVIRQMKNRIMNRYTLVPRIIGLLKVDQITKFTINLDRSPERWQTHLQRCSEVQLNNVQRFSAIDGKNYDINSEYIQNMFTLTVNFVGANRNTSGIIGCALSHYNLWQKVLEINKPVLIMEDDVNFDPHFVDRFGFLLNELEELEELEEDWHVVFLGYSRHEYNEKIHNLPENFLAKEFSPCDLIPFSFMTRYASEGDACGLHGGGTFGYLISPKGAQKMITSVKQTKFYFPVDYQILACGLYNDLNIKVCAHRLIYSPKHGEEDYISDIQVDID